MILLRYALIGLIIYLLVRSFMRFGNEQHASSGNAEPEKKTDTPKKKISKEIGEVIDYEEIEK